MMPDPVLSHAWRHEKESLDLGRQLGQEFVFELRPFVAVAQEHRVARGSSAGLRTAHEGREEWIGDVRHYQRDIAGSSRAQRTRGLVRHIAEPGRRSPHRFDGFAAQQMRCTEGA